MILTSESLSYIQNAVNTAEAMKLELLILEPGMIRGTDENITIFLIQTKDVPDMPFGSIAINRLNVFSSRLNLVKNMDKFEIDAVVQQNKDVDATPFVRSLVMKGAGTKIDYRCGNPALIKSPKGTGETFKYTSQFSSVAYNMIQKGQTAMAASEVEFIGTDDGVSFQITDDNGDALTYLFTTHIIDMDAKGKGNLINFTHKYPIKHILALFKANPDNHFQITPRGILKSTVNGLDVYIMQRED